jgi:uncharacterized protein
MRLINPMAQIPAQSGIDFPNYKDAWLNALQSLITGLSPNLYYHSVGHTRDDVVPAAQRLAAMEGVEGEGLMLLLTAAWYHDTGYIVRNDDNETIAVQIAAKALPDYGYTQEQIEVIEGIILATRLPQTPHNLLEELMADADLDILGREEFFDRSQLLRKELSAFGRETSEQEWCENQLQFLHSHHYFTASAIKLRQAGKQRNMEALLSNLQDCSSTLPFQEV